MATAKEWEAMKVALGPLYEDPRFEQYATKAMDTARSYVDFNKIISHASFTSFSPTERQMVYLAEMLYAGRKSQEFDLALLMDLADAMTWTRAIDAILIRRGVEVDIPAGQWLDKFPADS